MAVNHPGFTRITIEDVTYRRGNRGIWSPTTPPSRYEVYRWEVDNNCIPGRETYGNNVISAEEGVPQCHSHGASDSVEDRRIITAAVLNCGEIEANSPDGMSQRTDALPIETFIKIFLTEPMGTGQDNTIYGEIVGPIVNGEDTEANDLVAVRR